MSPTTRLGHVLRFVCAFASFAACAAFAQSVNYSDLWWNPAEPGWGFTIADHETNLFGVLYAYRSDGRPVWFTLPGGTFSQDRRIFQGDLYVTHGPPYTSAAFDPSQVSATKVGSAVLDFAPSGATPGTALLSYTINGVSQTKQIQRQPFGSAPPNWGTDDTDLWYSPAESGWGLSLAQHGNNIFGVWYTYDTDGEPLWFVLPGGSFTNANTFSGTLYRTVGPYFGNPSFNPSAVVPSAAGSATLIITGSPGSAAPAEKETACNFSVTFVTNLTTTPHLTCRQPFGNLAPKPATGTCIGTYSATFKPGFCLGDTFPAAGKFVVSGVNFNQQGPFVGQLQVAEPNIVFGDTADHPCKDGGGVLANEPPVAFVGSMDLSRIGQADIVIDYGLAQLHIHAQFSVGTSTVLGTLSGPDLVGSNNAFSCTY